MDEHVKAFIDRLIKTRFAELHGSSAHLHLQLSEKVLNELIHTAIESQKDDHPWLELIHAAHAKGTLGLELKINV